MVSLARILIDASNLHVGGGVQVAATFINDLVDVESLIGFNWVKRVEVHVSDAVMANLVPEARSRVSVANVGASLGFLRPRFGPMLFDVVFQVFGPSYSPRRGVTEIAGLADPRLPRGGWGNGSVLQRAKLIMKRSRVRQLDQIVVETQAYADAVQSMGVQSERIQVIPNTFAPEFTARSADASKPLFDRPEGVDLVLGYPARPYPHKNHAFLGEVHAHLRARGIEARFAVTLTPKELSQFGAGTVKACIPLGVITLSQCAALYRQVDAVFFPSLLEVFSATPLEALASNCLLFASDRSFIRTVVPDECACFFEPTDPASAADALQRLVSDGDRRHMMQEAGRAWAAKWPSARDRTLAYLDLIARVR